MIETVLIAVAVYIVANLVFGNLYLRTGIGKWFYHDICREHVPDDDDYTFDGCSIHSRCKYCEKELTLDDQGKWF